MHGESLALLAEMYYSLLVWIRSPHGEKRRGEGEIRMPKLLALSLGFSTAVFALVCLPGGQWSATVGLACALMALFLRERRDRRTSAALLAAGLVLGLLYTGLYGALFRSPAEALASEERQEVTCTVLDYPVETSYGVRLSVKLSLPHAPDPKVVLYADSEAGGLLPGDVITTSAVLRPAGIYRGESSDYYPSRGIYLTGYAGEVTLSERPEHIPVNRWSQVAAKALRDSVRANFPADIAGFVTALITGDKSTMPTGLYAAFRRAGLSHVVAVSGLHVNFLVALLTLLLGRRSRLSAGVGMALVFFFAAVAGNTPSVLRASLMEGLLLLAPLVGREEDRPTNFFGVLAFLLLLCPYSAASVGLQLSFAAVGGIYLLTGPLCQGWLKHIPKAERCLGRFFRKAAVFLLSTLATTLGALLFTTPLVAWYYRSVSLAGVLTNLLTLWAVSVTFMGSLIAAVAGIWLPGVGQALAWVIAWPTRWVCLTARAVARLPFAALSLSSVYLVVWFLFAYGVALACFFFRKKGVRPVIPVCSCLLTLCAAILMTAYPVLTGTLTVSVLDVGQGASALFTSKGHSVLVDCGGNSADDPGDIAADAVQALGTSHLDALVLTHCHTDHAGGVPELLGRLDVDLLFLPESDLDDPLRLEILALAKEHGCKVTSLSDDACLTFGDATMELYAPLGGGSTNEAGLSVLCEAEGFTVLVTGDMDQAVEKRLVKYKNLPDIDLLLVGHHGSKDSTGEALLLETTPEMAVISSGWNSYGHPSEETLERLGAAGCEIYLTKGMGTVTFTYKEPAKERN